MALSVSDYREIIRLTKEIKEEERELAEGYLQDRKFLKADKILAKHDENYMPPEVKEAISNN